MYDKAILISYIRTALTENPILVNDALRIMDIMRIPISECAVYDIISVAIEDYCTDYEVDPTEIYENEDDFDLFYDALQTL
jgi:hypothetical protein